ncbi:MAG: bifunctional DNA-formamidopyrimidine glycosylase/DNA-(apurinic or apyrimidinic site) lyase [Candidatus Zixiibacteriota bacterium]|nr:MAG: bifunctional DNA-formamidopyrimidine glycosylase/DNA-(apurinic or apyrimidinic site) lyase [candidate division Zixibacteria bacterium]
MPELPEVETIVRGLSKTIINQTIDGLYLNAPKIDADNFSGWLDIIKGKTFRAVRRRGKNILFDLSDGYTLWVHLRMTGHFRNLPRDMPIGKHDLMIFNFKNNSHSLRFNDYRRFGRLRLFKTDEVMLQKGLVDLGPEPLEVSRGDFVRLCRSSSRMIKPALLDQTFIAGLGNIYSDEALYVMRIHPRKSTGGIQKRKLGDLHGVIQELLRRSIRLMGTTVDTFAGINGRTGRFQRYLQVYGREGDACGRCGAIIRRVKVGSRSARFCPRCQRLR